MTTNAPAITAAFKVGETYSTRSSCDWDTVFSWTVVARTAKQVTLKSRAWGTVKRGVRVWNGVETCRPNGSYSMAPTISADRAGEIY